MENIKNSENIIKNKDYIESFFKIRIWKIILNNNKYKIFYTTFLDEKNEINKDKIKILLDIVYQKISNNDITNIRPNNIKDLDKNSIKKIISSFYKDDWNTRFSDDLFTFLEWRYSDLGLKIDYDIFSNKEIIDKVSFWFRNYVKNIYIDLNEWIDFFEVNEIEKIIQDIEEKILKLINT